MITDWELIDYKFIICLLQTKTQIIWRFFKIVVHCSMLTIKCLAAYIRAASIRSYMIMMICYNFNSYLKKRLTTIKRLSLHVTNNFVIPPIALLSRVDMYHYIIWKKTQRFYCDTCIPINIIIYCIYNVVSALMFLIFVTKRLIHAVRCNKFFDDGKQ